MLLTIASLVVVLGVLVTVHEFGHFVVAKAVGIQVLRFSIGFGRPLLQWRRGETEYWIAWIPLGGYVKMAGLEEEGMVGELEGGKADAAIDPERAFDKRPLWARMAVILAGVAMNLVLAFVIYTGLVAIAGEPRVALTPVDSVDTRQLPPGAAGLAELRRGDRITAINGVRLKTWDDLDSTIANGPQELQFQIAGRSEPIVVRAGQDTGARNGIVRALIPLVPARIGGLIPGQPAQKAGIQVGDVVFRVGADSVVSWTDLVHRIRGSAGKPLMLAIRRGDSVVQVAVTPARNDSGGQHFGIIGAGVDPPIERIAVSFATALGLGVRATAGEALNVVTLIKQMVFGQRSPRELGSVITIAQMSGQAARLGLETFLGFLALFSVSLAVLNLLPIPVLDGGHAMFLIAEAIRRRPLSPQLRLRLTQVGMLIVLGIMVLALSNDVIRLIR